MLRRKIATEPAFLRFSLPFAWRHRTRTGHANYFPIWGRAILSLSAIWTPVTGRLIYRGAQYGYRLLCVILLSNFMAILLQALSARLGIATGRNLAQACREWCPHWLSFPLWIACEIAIIACAVAEVIGTAIALQLLLGVIALCFTLQIIAAAPPVAELLRGFIPHRDVVTHPGMLYIAIGVIGATVMPHNLYLHSAIVQTRAYGASIAERRDALRWSVTDSSVALMLALFINAAILIVAAAAFHNTAYQNVAEIEDAYRLLSPVLGFGLASTLFAVALLAAGTNSTITGTLADQIVMEGFLHLRIARWARRLLTRDIAIIPVIFTVAFYGDGSVNTLLIVSQVVLSLQLPFAVIPLILFVSSRKIMGPFQLRKSFAVASWGVAGIILALNVKLLIDTLF